MAFCKKGEVISTCFIFEFGMPKLDPTNRILQPSAKVYPRRSCLASFAVIEGPNFLLHFNTSDTHTHTCSQSESLPRPERRPPRFPPSGALELEHRLDLSSPLGK